MSQSLNSGAFYDVVRFPVITEKAQSLSEGKIVFTVAPSATKQQVKAAIEKIFSVKVSKVNILNRKGKQKRFKGVMGKRKDVKRAIVTLAEGQALDILAGV